MSFQKFKELKQENIELKMVCATCGKTISQRRESTLDSLGAQNSHCKCEAPSAKQQLQIVSQGTLTNSPEAVATAGSETPSFHLDDRYEVLSLIGQGGMGRVYKVKDKILDKIFAVKVLRPELAADEYIVKRFEQEATSVINLTHTNIVAVYGHGVGKDSVRYLVMDYLEGQTLADMLKVEIYLDVPSALDILIQICEAVAHAHMKGIVHRDLKPSNIILTKTADKLNLVHVVDFGIAKALPGFGENTCNATRTSDIIGSPSYMSPEQCRGELVDERSDIYSLGCVMHETLAGTPPLVASNPIKTILKQVTDTPQLLTNKFPNRPIYNNLQRIILCCLEKDPENRYQNIGELLKDLRLVKDGREPAKKFKRTGAGVVPLTPAHLSAVFALTLVLAASTPIILEGEGIQLSYSLLGGWILFGIYVLYFLSLLRKCTLNSQDPAANAKCSAARWLLVSSVFMAPLAVLVLHYSGLLSANVDQLFLAFVNDVMVRTALVAGIGVSNFMALRSLRMSASLKKIAAQK